MSDERETRWSRRAFLGAAACAGSGVLLGIDATAAEPLPETKRIRLIEITGICVAPQYVAKELLLAEGFTDVQYFGVPASGVEAARAVAAGKADLTLTFVAPLIMQIEAGDPIVMLGGVHVGCFVLFGTGNVRAVRDLKGRTVGVQSHGSSQHVFLAAMMAHVGLDAKKDVTWATHSSRDSMQLLAEGKIDAFLGFPPDPQELKAKRIGHVIVDSGQDRPWSQYFCCMVGANRDFVRKHPAAAKRALRALLKASNVCALDPQRAAGLMAARGYPYDYALATLKDIPYDKWRDYDAEDSVRFYSLRLQEAGMIRSTPQKIISQGTDWRFFNELKRELKA